MKLEREYPKSDVTGTINILLMDIKPEYPIAMSRKQRIRMYHVSILLNQWFGAKVKGTVIAIAFTGSGFGGMILTPLINSIIEVNVGDRPPHS